MSFVEGSYDQMGRINIPPQGLYEVKDRQIRLGTRLPVGERVFRYAIAVDELAKAKVAVASASENGRAVPAESGIVGDFKVKVTATGANIIANQYVDGYLHVSDGTGAGDIYRVKEHEVIDQNEEGYVTLFDPLRTALSDSASYIQMISSPYRAKAAGTTQLQLPVGVPLVTIAAGKCGWVQTWGPCAVLIDGTGTYGVETNERLGITSANTAGAIMKPTAGKHITSQVMVEARDYVNARYEMVFLTIAP